MTPRLIARPTPQHLSLVGGEPEVLRGRHDGAVLQRSIEDAGDAVDLLRDAASAVAHAQLSAACGEADGADERLHLAASHFRRCGFGLVDLRGLGRDGGAVSVEDGHHALGLAAGRTRRTTPACPFTAGWLAGAASAAFDRELGAYRAVETRCAALAGGSRCDFYVEPLRRARTLRPSVGAGVVPATLPPRRALATSVDEPAVLAALAALPLEGDEEGLIPAFGLHLTRHYANYHDAISYELERRLEAERPHLPGAAEAILVEAGHVCAFNTLGGIMRSPEWQALILPMCRERSDWISGIVACVNAFGWGRWTVEEVVPGERLVVRVDAGHEANHYLAAYGAGDRPRCYMCRGGVAGIMNLLYTGDITARPALDAAYHDDLFSRPGSFRAAETRCRSKGDDRCELVATRASLR